MEKPPQTTLRLSPTPWKSKLPITENLFVGSCLLDSKNFEDLRSLGITASLSLQTPEDMGQRGVGWEEKAALNAKLAFRSAREGLRHR